MKPAALHPQESARIDALNEYQILDTLPEQEFDDLTQIAASICGTEIALVSLVDKDRQWFKSRFGLDAEQTPRDLAFCAHAILQDDVFEVEDASKDDRFFDNPLVTQAPDIRFYAGAPIYAHNGLPVGTLCVIDKQPKKLTDDQQEALFALARQVMSQLELRRNIMELQQSQLQLEENNKELKRLTRHRTQFINHVSHEIRTPLNAILGFSRILSRQMPTEQQNNSEYVLDNDKPETLIDLVKVSAENLSETVNHVLDLSRLEAGKMTLQDEDVLLEALAKDIMVINSQRAKEKNIQLTSELSPALPRCIRTDKTKLLQILINLVGNAIKFTPAGKRVTLQINSENGTLNVHVKDEGVGIAAENIDKVFRPFQQVENSESQLYAGSGLGLTICRELADFLGGSLNVSSTLHKGSEFVLRLPLVAGNESLVQSDLTLKTLDLSDKKILVIEDNRVNQLVIKAMLKSSNAQLSFADNGNEGIKEAMRILPDLIMIDIRLPDMDGFSILSQLKSHESTAAIPMIVVSGDVTNENYQKAETLGAHAFIEKPLDELKLMRLLDQLFKR